MQKKLMNNLPYKIMSIIFATILWLVVVNIDDPIITTTISGIQVNTENDNLITSQDRVYTVVSGTTATVKVKGPRSIVDNLEASDFVATADFNELSLTNAIPITIKLSSDNSKYASKIEIIDKTSSMIITLENIQTKTFDFEVSYSGEPATGYIVGSQELSNASVVVSAPKSILDTIDSAVLKVDTSGKSTDFSVNVQPTLIDDNGDEILLSDSVSIDKNSINVKVIMNKIKEVPLNFGTTGSVASGYEFVGLQYSPQKITIKGVGTMIDAIESITIPDSLIDLSEATQEIKEDIDISSYLPEGISLYDETKKIISVTVQIQGPSQKTFTLNSTKIELRNIPSGYTGIISTNPITINLSGTSSIINAVDATQISGYVDMTGGTEGVNERQLKLTLPTGTSLVDEVSVSVQLTKTTIEDQSTGN